MFRKRNKRCPKKKRGPITKVVIETATNLKTGLVGRNESAQDAIERLENAQLKLKKNFLIIESQIENIMINKDLREGIQTRIREVEELRHAAAQNLQRKLKKLLSKDLEPSLKKKQKK